VTVTIVSNVVATVTTVARVATVQSVAVKIVQA
jgi:hypothetical protein